MKRKKKYRAIYYMLQSVHFKRDIWTPNSARLWLLSHNIVPIKPLHATETMLKYRISEPKHGKYHSKYVTNGVLFIFD